MADTAYRLAMSYIALCQGQPRSALRYLGYNENDVPIFEGFDAEALLLRSHAFEAQGHAEAAFMRLRARMVDVAWFRPLLELSRRDPRFVLCPGVMPQLERELLDQAARRLQPPPVTLRGVLLALLAAAGVDAGVFVQVSRYDHPDNDLFVRWAVVLTVAALALSAWLLRRYLRYRSSGRHATLTVGHPTSPVGQDAFARRIVRAHVTHEGVVYPVRARVVRGMIASARAPCPCLFDPKTRSARILLPFHHPPLIVPFG